MAFLDRVEQQSRYSPQIQRIRVNSMLLTTVAYSDQLIQAYRGKKLTSNGQKNIPYKILGLLQLGPDLVYSLYRALSLLSKNFSSFSISFCSSGIATNLIDDVIYYED
jgi:hypothetical protein